MRGLAVAAIAVACLAACRVSVDPDPVPAVLIAVDDAARSELVAALSAALNRTAVRVAADALQHDSELVIERAPARDPSGLPLNGRESARPQHFRLLLISGRCVLEHDGGGRAILRHARCAPRLPGASQ